MTAASIFQEAVGVGLTLSLERGENIAITGPLTADLMAKLVAAKPALLELLRSCTMGLATTGACPVHGHAHGELDDEAARRCDQCGAAAVALLVTEARRRHCRRCL